MTAAEFATLLELSPVDYAAYEAGMADPSLTALAAAHRRTGVSLDWLIAGSDIGPVQSRPNS